MLAGSLPNLPAINLSSESCVTSCHFPPPLDFNQKFKISMWKYGLGGGCMVVERVDELPKARVAQRGEEDN